MITRKMSRPGARLTLLGSLLVALLCLVGPRPARAGAKEIVLAEHLNRRWEGQLVTYPLEAPKGQCVPGSVTLAGPNGPTAVQLSEVEVWPGTGQVKSARLSFVVRELKPLSSHTYTVSYGPKPASSAPAAADLKLVATDGQVETTTGRYGARLLVGQKDYETPAAAADVPGPILAMRLADGTWFGGSRLYGESLVKSWSSKLTAEGPVFARVETVYTYADGNTLKVSVRLADGDYALLIDMDVGQDAPDDGWELLLGGGVRVREGVLVSARGPFTKELPAKLDAGDGQPVCYLNTWPSAGWFGNSPGMIRLKLDGRASELQLSVRDPGAWVEPSNEQPWMNFTLWTYEMIPRIWSGWQSKRIPLMAEKDGDLRMRINLFTGRRKWTVGQDADGRRLLDTYRGKEMTAHTPAPRLDEVKDMVLDWPDGRAKHPYLFMDARQVGNASARNTKAYAQARSVAGLRATLNRLGDIDLMRHVMAAAAQYDMIIDSDLITPAERKLFKAQAAYLGYQVVSPLHWSYERGYCSGNPNMTVSRIANMGVLGCALRDNPAGKRWALYAIDWAKYWLKEVTDEKGCWPESSHYARVSWSGFVQLAIAARRAGYHNFFADPKFKAMGLFYEKTLTPPDPLRRIGVGPPREDPSRGVRVGAPYGRGTRGDAWGLNGLLARATAASDPAYSRVMQWSWQASGYVERSSHNTAGVNSLYADPRLPARAPDWRSEYFPHLGYILRSYVGTPAENYLLFVSHYYRAADGEIWPADTGGIAKWFANGRPIGGAFKRIPESSHVLLENRVMLACNWDPAVGVSPESGYVTRTSQDAFAPLPLLDYVSVGFDVPEIKQHHLKMPRKAPAFPKREAEGEPPFHWQRQALLTRSEHPGGVNYLVLRDTVSGGQPTQWHFWTLSEKIGTPQQAADREAFLKDKPGNKVCALRELVGDRFTALGQFDVDLDYYIAGPTGTPRYTLRYGTGGSAYGLRGFYEFQDLLHLQMGGDGCYFVAMFPRGRDEPAPAFSTLAKGKVIRIAGAFGTDYCFLSEEPDQVRAGPVRFAGTAGMVQDRPSGLALMLGAEGSVSCGDYSLAAAAPASLRVAPYGLRLELPEGAVGGKVTFRAPGRWSLHGARPGAALSKGWRSYVLTFADGTRCVQLTRQP